MATFLDPRFKCHFSDDTVVADIKETLQEALLATKVGFMQCFLRLLLFYLLLS